MVAIRPVSCKEGPCCSDAGDIRSATATGGRAPASPEVAQAIDSTQNPPATTASPRIKI